MKRPGSPVSVGASRRLRRLPGSRQVFNLSGSVWDTRADDDDPRVPLLAIAGRLGVVNAKSANIPAAFQLLLWLSDNRMSPQISAASPATTLFRQSNLKSPGQWVEKPVFALAAVQYGDATEAALRHEQCSARCDCPAGPSIWRPWTMPWRQPSAAKKPVRCTVASRQEMARNHRPSRPRPPTHGLSTQPGLE